MKLRARITSWLLVLNVIASGSVHAIYACQMATHPRAAASCHDGAGSAGVPAPQRSSPPCCRGDSRSATLQGLTRVADERWAAGAVDAHTPVVIAWPAWADRAPSLVAAPYTYGSSPPIHVSPCLYCGVHAYLSLRTLII